MEHSTALERVGGEQPGRGVQAEVGERVRAGRHVAEDARVGQRVAVDLARQRVGQLAAIGRRPGGLQFRRALGEVQGPGEGDLGVDAGAVGLGGAWSAVESATKRPPRAAGVVVTDEGDGGVKLAEFLASGKFI